MKIITAYIILFVVICLILYDVYVAVNKEKGDTISEIITEASFRRPMIPFAFGVLMGHWFW